MQNYSGKTAEAYGGYKVQDEVDHYVDIWMADRLRDLGAMRRVVDVGCGAGRWFSKFQADNIVGIDISEDMLKSVGRETRAGVDLICGDFLKELAGFDNNFDLAFASYSLCTLENPRVALNAMHRAVRPGGRALFSTNIVVDERDIPSVVEASKLELLENIPSVELVRDGQRKKLRLVLHFKTGDLAIHDFAHTVEDYMHGGWLVEKMGIFKPCKASFVDAADNAMNGKYFPGQPDSEAISLIGKKAGIVNLCMQTRKI